MKWNPSSKLSPRTPKSTSDKLPGRKGPKREGYASKGPSTGKPYPKKDSFTRAPAGKVYENKRPSRGGPSPIAPKNTARTPREVREVIEPNSRRPAKATERSEAWKSKSSSKTIPSKAGPVATGKFVPKPVIDDDRRVYGIHAVTATLEHMPERAKKLYYIEKTPRTEPIIQMAQKAGLIIEQTARQIFDVNYGTDIVHQGVMLMTAPFPYVNLDEGINKNTTLVVVLDGIEDPRNLGRAARSAFALGAQLLIIPTNRAAGVSASAEKAAVGTFSRIPVAQVTNLNQALEKLKKAGLWVVGSAGEATTSLWGADLRRPTALVIGSEESGLRKLVRENCDELVRIPMKTEDMSLNAADALTIMLYEVQRQRATVSKS